MDKAEDLKVDIEVVYEKYTFLCIPFGSYTKVNDTDLVTIFGIPVYQRVGGKSKLLWFKPKEK